MNKFTLAMALFGFAWEAQAKDIRQPSVTITGSNGSEIKFGSDAISEVELHERRNFNQITFNVNPQVARSFTELTTENVGQTISISVCGTDVSRPMVQSPIYGRGLAFSGLEPEKAKIVAQVLTGQRTCD